MLLKCINLSLILYIGRAVAAFRRDNQTICDYYAEKNYGESSVKNQHRLMQGIVAYAYAGGDALPDPNANSTGIFKKGQFNGYNVFLRPLFDGSKATTNFNGQPEAINWLDGGGLDPLLALLNGSTVTAEIRPKSNQEILFSHWYVTFGKVYQCSNASQFVAKEYAPFTPAYVHKFMNLNATEVAYFIDQLMLASKYHNFSDADAQQLAATMNTKYNNQCSPPDENGQLNSVCFAETCPEAVPRKDCEAYKSLEPYGFKASTPKGTATGVIPTMSSPPNSTTTSSGEVVGGSSSSLSAGAIAGIVIGGSVVILMAVGMWLHFRRQQQNKTAETPAAAQNQMSQAGSTAFSNQSPYSHPHDSYYSRGPHDSYAVSTIGSPVSTAATWEQSKLPQLQEMAAESPSPPPGMLSPNNQWGQMHQIAEMESPDPPPPWSQEPKP
ncbi:hypothetical protein J3458_001709 [Metarhizium acridum]|uniref:uncharacterized protein n=1 Tax=Metarhizium acridum TaxID=92637 RepID=UPI001C6BD74C|nr:hypothetical protein J3458_001709 [Metarhizium acridum]